MIVSSVWQCFSVHGEREVWRKPRVKYWYYLMVVYVSVISEFLAQHCQWAAVMTLNQDWSVETPLALPPSLLSCSHRAHCPQFSSSHWSAQDLLHQLMLMTFSVSFYENYPLTSLTLTPWSDTIVVVSVMHQWVCDIEANNVNREQFQQHPTVGHSHASHILIRILILFSFAENRQWDRYY